MERFGFESLPDATELAARIAANRYQGAMAPIMQESSPLRQNLDPADAARALRISQFRERSGLDEALNGDSYGLLQDLAARLIKRVTAGSALELGDVAGTLSLASAFAPLPLNDPKRENNLGYFMEQLTQLLTWEMDITAIANVDTRRFLPAFDRVIARFGEATPTGPDWHRRRMRLLMHHVEARKTHEQALAGMAASGEQISSRATQELRATNNQLVDQIQKLRQFSIKSALHPEGDMAWTIQDAYDMYTQFKELGEQANSGIHPEEWIDVRMIAIRHPATKQPLLMSVTGLGEIARPGIPLPPIYFLSDEGDIYFDPSGTVPAELAFRRHHLQGHYEMLRASLLGRFYDLTVPIEVMERTGSETEAARPRTFARGHSEESQKAILMLIPRIRVLGRSTREELEHLDELERYYEKVVKDVDAFTRWLPKGYQASKDAKELAEKLGIEIPPGKTLVQPHKRGRLKLKEPRGHIAKKRDRPKES